MNTTQLLNNQGTSSPCTNMEEYDILIYEKIKVDSRMYIMLASVSFVGYEGYFISFKGFLPTSRYNGHLN